MFQMLYWSDLGRENSWFFNAEYEWEELMMNHNGSVVRGKLPASIQNILRYAFYEQFPVINDMSHFKIETIQWYRNLFKELVTNHD